jgi:hypothetical protein
MEYNCAMGPARGAVNISDIVVGSLLLLVLPIVTLLSLPKTSEEVPPAQPEGGKKVLAPSLEELEEGRQEYVRIFNQNSKLFLIRSRDPDLQPEYQADEARWARSTLERCRKGFTGLLEGARAGPATTEYQARIAEFEDWIRKIEAELRSLPAEAAARPPAAPPATPLGLPGPPSGTPATPSGTPATAKAH